MGGCLKFRPKRSSDKWWLEFFYGGGCFSPVGRKYWKTGATRISIGRNCNYVDIVQHEMLHALGFPHEQSRTDRDKYVVIYPGRIIQGMEANFAKSKLTASYYFGTPYDYKSIMHYSKTAFSRGGRKPTIERKRYPNTKLGGRVMTKIDIEELKEMYQCSQRRSGWSRWIDTPCLCTSDKKFCTISKVRICLGTRECSGPRQQYGTQYQSKLCKAEDEGKGGAKRRGTVTKKGKSKSRKSKTKVCKDNSRYARSCKGWAKKGECKRNALWMGNNCCKSCRGVSGTKVTKVCQDNKRWAKQCPGWAKRNQCKANPKWMADNCCKSCARS